MERRASCGLVLPLVESAGRRGVVSPPLCRSRGGGVRAEGGGHRGAERQRAGVHGRGHVHSGGRLALGAERSHVLSLASHTPTLLTPTLLTLTLLTPTLLTPTLLTSHTHTSRTHTQSGNQTLAIKVFGGVTVWD